VVTTAQGAVKTPMSEAAERYFNNLVAKGRDGKTIKTYKVAVYGFIDSCEKIFIEDVEEQDLINYMAWLRRQPQKLRKHANPERTYFNKCSFPEGLPQVRFAQKA
jgi:Phage integrase, N-terminal SAM-like domain